MCAKTYYETDCNTTLFKVAKLAFCSVLTSNGLIIKIITRQLTETVF